MSRTRYSRITPADVAEAMELTIDQCWSMARHLDDHFFPERPRPDGKRVRWTRGPKPEARKHLRSLHRYLATVAPPHPSVHGGARKGAKRSCVSGARQHLGRRFVVTRDVENCYPSIEESTLRKRLKELGFRHDTAALLASLMTINGRLTLGSPVSTDALNLFFMPADRRVTRKAHRRGMPFERTHDDLVISADSYEEAKLAGRWLEAAITESGLRVSEKKKASHGIQPASRRQLVHNIQVNNPRGTTAVAEQVQTALGLGESYVRSAKCVSAESLEPLAKKRDRVTGWINHLDQLHYSPVRQLRRLLRHGDRHVQRKMESLNLEAQKNKWWLRSQRHNEPARLATRWKDRLRMEQLSSAP